MANDLTGDYDVVAEFALAAVNRILAGMHRGKRLPHSLSMAVDDLPDFRLGVTAVSVVDIHGAALADAGRVKQAAYASLKTATPLCQAEVQRNVDPVVNWRPEPSAPKEIKLADFTQEVGEGFAGIGINRTSNFIAGVAQLQLGPPTMQLPQGRTDRAEIHTPAMIRYVSDEDMRPLSDFMRGDVVTTFGVKQTASPTGNNVVVDLAGTAGNVHFNPAFSANSLDASDRAAIDKVIYKSLKESFQPSSTPLPANVRKMHFKGFPAEGGVAVLMNVTTNNNPSPNSIPNGFLRPEDHFALGVNGDSITQPFAAAVNGAISPRQQKTDTKVVIDYFIGTKTFHIFTTVTVLDASVQLVNIPLISIGGVPGTGQILLTIPVQVRFGWESKPTVIPDPVDFDFKIMQIFTLTLNGRHVGLQRLGDVIIDIPASVPDEEKNPARNQAKTLFNNAWNSRESQIQAQIDKALNADGLQAFVKSLMNPKGAKLPATTTVFGAPNANVVEEVDPVLAYTFFEIKPSGIILHGSLALPPWPAAHVEFDKDPWATPARPEYRALNSWIPGGTIQEYQWSFQGSGTVKDANRFVTIVAPAITSASNRICLTYTGSRITAAGPIFYESVNSPRTCKWTSIPISKYTGVANLEAGNRPHVAVPKPGPTPEEKLEVVAHASPWAPEGLGGGTANFVVHFPDESSAAHLDMLPRALAQSGRADTATAILCVLTPEQLANSGTLEGIMYADDAAAWEHLLKIRSRPATVVLDPSGHAVWRHEGEIGASKLAEALRAHLAEGGQFYPQFIKSPLTIGEQSPNFIFESEPGERLTLRMLSGRPLVLLFWRSASGPSIAVLRNLHKAFNQPDVEAPLIVAINDGESGEFARGLATGEEGSVVVVPDTDRQIARAYGISLWPTIVFLDADGVVRDVRTGLITEQELETSVLSRPAPNGHPAKEC